MVPHREFFRIPDDDPGWQTIPGYTLGFRRIVLSDTLDEGARTGRRTSLIRVAAGTVLPRQVVHPFAEEVYVAEGDLVVGCDPEGAGGEVFHAPAYAIRPADVLHGPFATCGGCTMFEIHYFDG